MGTQEQIEQFVNKWSCFWLIRNDNRQLTKAFITELMMLIGDKVEKRDEARRLLQYISDNYAGVGDFETTGQSITNIIEDIRKWLDE